MVFIRKLLERSRENHTPSVFSVGGALNLGTHPSPSFLTTKPQDKIKYWAVPYPVPPPTPTFFSSSFFLSLEPSEKHQGTEVSTFSYNRSLAL